ncbi:hypothetical protein ScPMuIL_008645 [Solemya velum]
MVQTFFQKDDPCRIFLAGISNMCGAALTNPFDVIKVRMQLENQMSVSTGHSLGVFGNRYYNGVLRGGTRIFLEEGVKGLYRGLFIALVRDGTYSAIRLGAYEPVKRFLGATDKAHTPLWKKICAGAISGAFGSSFATPTDVIKVRLQTEGMHGKLANPQYRNTWSTFRYVLGTEGVRGLYRGAFPTMKRAALMTASQVPTYDHTKHTILNAGVMEEGMPLHIVSSLTAGFVGALATSPVDTVKTRVMSPKKKGK